MLDDHGHTAVVAGVPLLVVGEDGRARRADHEVGATLDRQSAAGAGRRSHRRAGQPMPSSTAYSSSNALTAKTSMNAQPGPLGDALELGDEPRHAVPRGRQVRRQQRLEVAVGEAVAARVPAGELDRSLRGRRPVPAPMIRPRLIRVCRARGRWAARSFGYTICEDAELQLPRPRRRASIRRRSYFVGRGPPARAPGAADNRRFSSARARAAIDSSVSL